MRETPAAGAARALAALLLFTALFWTLDLAGLRAGVPDPRDDTWEYGVAARELRAGHGFRTLVIHPPLWSLRDPRTNAVPLLIHGPLLPLLIAPFVRLGGAGVLDGMAWLAALFAVLTAASIFRLGARQFGAAVGLASASVFTLCPLTLNAVHHDVSLMLGAWLLSLALDLLARETPRGTLAGIAVGLGSLARPEMLLAAMALLAFARRGAWRGFVLAFAACAVPWWWHNLRAAGSPLFNLSSYLLIGYWDGRPGLTVLRDFHLTPHEWPAALAAALPGLPAKWAEFLPHALKRALLTPSGGTGGLALIGLAAAIRHPASRRLAGVAALLALVPIAVMTLTLYDSRYLTPFLPLWAIGTAVGAETLVRFLPSWAHRPRAWAGILLLLLLPSIAPALRESVRDARGLTARLARARRGLTGPASDESDRSRLMFSDTPDFVAWTTGRPTVWVTREEYQRFPVSSDSSARPETGALPARGKPSDEWFADEPANGGP